jgi:hypothetical protein
LDVFIREIENLWGVKKARSRRGDVVAIELLGKKERPA